MKISLMFAIFLTMVGNLIAAPASNVSYRGGEGGGREGGRPEGGGSYHGGEYHGGEYHGNEHQGNQYRGQQGQTPYRGTENFDYGKSNVNATTIERHHDYNERQDANQWDDGGAYYVQPVYPSGATGGTYYPPAGTTGATGTNPDAVQNNSSQWGN